MDFLTTYCSGWVAACILSALALMRASEPQRGLVQIAALNAALGFLLLLWTGEAMLSGHGLYGAIGLIALTVPMFFGVRSVWCSVILWRQYPKLVILKKTQASTRCPLRPMQMSPSGRFTQIEK